jgi:hypothetical protein
MRAGSMRSIVAQQPHCLAELDLGGAEHGLPVAIAVLRIGRHELTHLGAFQRPAVGARDGLQFVACLGHADVEHLLVVVAAGENEVHTQCRLAGARPAFDKVKTAQDKAAAEDIVETR